MTKFRRGDVILVSFIFTDESGVKRRPAVIISSDTYHKGRDEAIIAAISSNTERMLVGDNLINDWQTSGLLFPSVATSIIRTIKHDMIAKKLGAMSTHDMAAIDMNLKLVLVLS
ncbi:MAG: type II toxin-antitoxin system PemK/MazF family toxin [Dehalococcoidales bacterium]|nr:type II toxin-antitoxin system PemK/MazF family toxin [Dehalococcoidales bacterium]